MGGIESSMFTILDLLLLHESWILKLVLISTDDGVTGPCKFTRETIFDIRNCLRPRLTTDD